MKGKEKQLPGLTEAANGADAPVKKDKKPGKLFIILSYALVLAGLIAAFFVPLYGGEMLAKYLLAAVGNIIEIPSSAYGTFFIRDTGLMLYEWVLILALAVSLVLALILLIPVIAGKPAKRTNLKCAFAGEFIAFIFTLAFAVCELYDYTVAAGVEGKVEWANFATLIPLGLAILVMAAQSIKYKGWLGTVKFIAFLLALLTLFTLFDIAAIIPALESPLLSISEMLGASKNKLTFMGVYPNGLSGLYEIIMLYENTDYLLAEGLQTAELVSRILFAVISILVVLSVITDLLALVVGNKVRQKAKGDKKSGVPLTHKGRFVFALVRYILIVLLIVAAVLLGTFLDGSWKAGLYMYFTAVVVILSLIVEVIRYCVAKSKLKKYNAEQKRLFDTEKLIIVDPALQTAEENAAVIAGQPIEENAQLNFLGENTVMVQTPVEEPAEEQLSEDNGEQLTITEVQPVEEPAEEVVFEEQTAPVAPVAPVEVAEEQPAPVEVAEAAEESFPVYMAPEEQTVEEEQPVQAAAEQEIRHIDPFVDKLTDSERAEFFDVFVNRNKGKIGTVPVYELNGNNSAFFPSVFVHINRTREMCSDSLLNKIYGEIGKN